MTTGPTFEESLAYLDSLYHRPVLPARQVGLARIEYLLAQLGEPHRAFRSVHVAGSAGKGSTTTMIGELLRAAGYLTGYYRKPHLESITERITIGTDDITPDEWTQHWQRLYPIVDAMLEGRAMGYRLGRPTYFEVVYALAMMHLAQSGVEWAVVETGIGGRLDATNTLRPDVAVVTNVSLEHTQFLGKTEAEIAVEKAAIIKGGAHAVTAASGAALAVIQARAAEVGAPLLVVPRDVGVQVQEHTISGQRLAFVPSDGPLTVRMPLAGEFQATNAATAFAAVVALRERGVIVDDAAIAHGFSGIRVPGRFEVMARQPLIILDGAHNAAASRELATSLRHLLPDERVVLLFAAMADKDVVGMAEALASITDTIVITHAPDSERTASPEAVAAIFRPHVLHVYVESEPDDALDCARRLAAQSRTLVVTGSMYLVGRVRGILHATGVSA